MGDDNRYLQLVQELLDGIDRGDFADVHKLPNSYTYEHMLALFLLAPYLEGGVDLYKQLHDLVVKLGKLNVRKKYNEGKKIRVAFLTISAAEWQAEELYHKIKNDDRFECFVVVAPLIDRDRDSMLDTYNQTCSFFENNGYSMKKGYDVENDMVLNWDELGGIPDVLVHLTSWYESLPIQLKITSLPLKCLNMYIPYSMHIGDSKDGAHVKKFIYNKDIVNLCYRVYADSQYDLEGYQKHELLQGKNIVYSGYLKMDYFLQEVNPDRENDDEIWKFPDNTNGKEMKKVIVAPHHSFKGYGGLSFATFEKNKYLWPYLAKKYEQEITFIFKPHPNLRLRAVEAGVFESYEEYDAYLDKLGNMPNVKIVQEADYLSIFATSDAMIMDSISFLGEYLYADKPLLFLKKKGQAFNGLGEKVISAYYSADGEDYWNIEGFLKDVVLQENDYKKELREDVFKKELDYFTKNGKSACQVIYDDFDGLLTDCQ